MYTRLTRKAGLDNRDNGNVITPQAAVARGHYGIGVFGGTASITLAVFSFPQPQP